MILRGDNSSPFQRFAGDKWTSPAILVKLGSRDRKKTHGTVTENYLEKVLPDLGFVLGDDFVIDQLDGTSKYQKDLEISLGKKEGDVSVLSLK